MPIDPMPTAGTGGASTGYLAQAQASYASSGQSAQDDPPVWMGGTAGRLDPITGAPHPYTIKQKVPKRSSEVISDFSKWSNKKKKDLARRLAMAGYFGSPNIGESLDDFVATIPLADLEKAWAQVVLETAQKNANEIWVTPEQLIQQQIDYNRSVAKGTEHEAFFSGKSPSAAEKDPNRTEKFTSFSRDIFSASQARGLIREVLQKELGRDPTEEEFQDFKDALQTEQQQNPTRTVQSTVYRDGDPVRQSTTSTGGVDPTEFAVEQAQANPDWAEWQAVGTYFPAAMNALGAGVPGA